MTGFVHMLHYFWQWHVSLDRSYNLWLNLIVSHLLIGICVVSWIQDWVALCMLEYRIMAKLLVCDLHNTNRITCCSVCRMLWMLSDHLSQVSCTVPSLYLSFSEDMITHINCELIFINYWSEVLTVVNIKVSFMGCGIWLPSQQEKCSKERH